MRAFSSAVGLAGLLATVLVGSVDAQPVAEAHAGSGFFIGRDGTMLTAAHVVRGCRRIDVASADVPPSPVRLLRADSGADVAVLRLDGRFVPATLALADSASSGLLRAYGFSSTTGPMLAASAQPTLLNARIKPGPPADPRDVLWLGDRRIVHGWSGGPVLDAADRVIGMIMAIEPNAAETVAAFDRPQEGVALAAGYRPLQIVLDRTIGGAARATQPGGTASRAMVRVICWK